MSKQNEEILSEDFMMLLARGAASNVGDLIVADKATQENIAAVIELTYHPALARIERLEQEDALRSLDNPELDGTPHEHPAYRRGDDHGSAVALQTKQQNAALRTALDAAGRVIAAQRKYFTGFESNSYFMEQAELAYAEALKEVK